MALNKQTNQPSDTCRGQRELQAAFGRYIRTFWMLVLSVGFGAPNLVVSGAAADKQDLTHRRFHEGRILIQPKATADAGRLKQFHAFHRMRGVRRLSESTGLEIVDLPAGATVANTIKKYRDSGFVEFAEPDYYLHASLVPNDPQFHDGLLWPFNNTGQNGGTADADIDAVEAWEVLHSASNIVVAVVDSGIRYTHEDLAANMWHNPGEIPNNGLDDDGNGIVDDVYGVNAVTNGGNPFDDSGHGTHVAGIIGAEGNNGKGGAGVAWSVRLMACKFMDQEGMGATSDAIQCIDYARKKGAHIINASWGGPDSSLALESAIRRCRDAGIIFVAAAGNEGVNNDLIPSYPANYSLDNIVSVAAITRHDTLDTTYSNFGKSKVDLAAPGTSIYSTWSTSDSAYSNMSGTSMATPFVAGVFALVRAKFPTATYGQAIKRVFDATDKLSSLAGKCVTGGRVNLNRALQEDPTVIPMESGILSISPATGFGVLTLPGDAFNVESHTYVLSNSGNKSLSWVAVQDQSWLAITPAFGAIAPGESMSVTASVLPAARSLPAGTYSGSLTFQDDTGKSQSPLPISLTIEPPPAPPPAGILSVAPVTGFDVRGFPGGGFNIESQTYILSNPGNKSFNWWIATHGQAWLEITPAFGAIAPGESTIVTASLRPEARSLAVGTYSGSLLFQDDTGGAPQSPLPVSLTIQALPSLEVVPNSPAKIFQFQLSCQAGMTIVTEASSDLQTWTPIATNTVPIDGRFAFSDPDGQTLAQRFFRARFNSSSEVGASKVPMGAASVKK